MENEEDTSSVILNQTGPIQSEPSDLKAENMGDIKGVLTQMSNSIKLQEEETNQLQEMTIFLNGEHTPHLNTSTTSSSSSSSSNLASADKEIAALSIDSPKSSSLLNKVSSLNFR